MANEQVDESGLMTAASLVEKAKLRRHFGRFDIFFFLLCTIVGVDTLGQVASAGPQGFVWLIILCLFFFVPYGLLTAELGAAFPEEGGPYIWTRMAWGRKVAGLNAIFYWFSNPVWIGATLALLCISAIQNYFWHFADGSNVGIVIGLVFIWFSVASAILSFGIGKWIPTMGAFSRLIMIGTFSVTTLVYAAKHGLHLPQGSTWTPTWASFIALTPLLFYNLVGFELPSSAGDEMKNPQKDVPYTVLRAMITSILLYGLPILAIVCVIPPADIKGKGVSAFLDAVDTVFSVYGGAADVMIKFTALMFIVALISSGSSWLMGADRAQAIAAIDGTGPKWIGEFSSRFGTPVHVNYISGLVATVAFVAAEKAGNGSTAQAFNIMIGIVLLFTTISYFVIFPSLIKLRKSHPHVNRPYKVPGGMKGVWVCAVITTIWSAIATIAGIFPGIFTNGHLLDDSALPDGVSRLAFTSYAFIAIGVTLLVGIVFYALGSKTRSELVHDPELVE